jgi:alpha,alpha-trehalase
MNGLKLPPQIHELGELFEVVQMKNIFDDGKTFPDCIPKRELFAISMDFEQLKGSQSFNLEKFVLENFELPRNAQQEYASNNIGSVSAHIDSLWRFLTRKTNPENSSLIQLPHAYVVPGGRFRECYYWDSYFTMLGLQNSGRIDLIKNMIDNFAFLIDTIGFIPNGNRSYFLSRSQPPFFSLMLRLLGDEPETLKKYLPQLEREYGFWMDGLDLLSETNASYARVVRLGDGSIVNRYWDSQQSPRPESYKEDVELSCQCTQPSSTLFRNLRAAAESGWDFSSRWFNEPGNFSSVHTTDIIPIDLNCLMLHLEQTLAKAYDFGGQQEMSNKFSTLVERRKLAIQKYCWDDARGFYFDYDFQSKKLKGIFSLAGYFPMFFKMATSKQVKNMAWHIESKFLKAGGLTTTQEFSGQQWDAPNGWAPLQWICFKGLLNYGLNDVAERVKNCWLSTIEAVFMKTGKMTEKYDVLNEHADASGGEYPNQDGFGWTNGVYLAMSSFVTDDTDFHM